MVKVIHVIVGLGSGGAENMLYKILKYSNKNLYMHEVISLTNKGELGSKIESLGIKVFTLNLKLFNAIKSIYTMSKISKNGDVINSWMYHSDFISFIIAKVLNKKKLIWNVRHSNLNRKTNKFRTLLIAKINAKVSRKVDIITYNSEKAFEEHIKFGYFIKNARILNNGFEIDKFRFDLSSRMNKRKELGINDSEMVLITIGRWNIQKDYNTLMKALYLLKQRSIDYKMIFIGKNLDHKNNELLNLISQFKLDEDIILLGLREDISDLLSAGDIYISSSLGESFSNSIGEAMACELTCVVTDAGDSRKIVGDYGYVVKIGDSLSLSVKIEEIINTWSMNSVGKNARQRILENYEINTVVKIYEENFQIN